MTTKIDKDTWSKALYQFVEDDAEILPLEKQPMEELQFRKLGKPWKNTRNYLKQG